MVYLFYLFLQLLTPCKRNCKPSPSTQSTTNQNSTTPAFAKSLKTISDRHYADKVTQSSLAKDKNTVVNRKIVNVPIDVQAIRTGKAKFINNQFHINGRIYGHHDGTLFPVSGNGFYLLNRIEYKTLGVYNQLGNNDRSEQILNNMKVDKATKDKVLRIYREIQ